jgi:hypothetical protein
MRIREATEKDKNTWDAFIDSQDGTISFSYYFDWKYICESQDTPTIQIMIENEQLELICLFILVKTYRPFYSILRSVSGGPLFRIDLTINERHQVLRTLIKYKYIDNNYAAGCSTFEIEDLKMNTEHNSALIESIFRRGNKTCVV